VGRSRAFRGGSLRVYCDTSASTRSNRPGGAKQQEEEGQQQEEEGQQQEEEGQQQEEEGQQQEDCHCHPTSRLSLTGDSGQINSRQTRGGTRCRQVSVVKTKRHQLQILALKSAS
jgi:hypothetical protein